MADRFARVPARAAGLQLTGRDLRVLIAIAAHANADGYAFPSLATIARLVGIDRSKVPPSVRRLEEAGLMRKFHTPARRTATYQMTFEFAEQLARDAPKGGNSDAPKDGNSDAPTGGNSDAPKGGNRIITDSLNRDFEQGHARAISDFDRFWQAYPSRSPFPHPMEPARAAFNAHVRAGIAAETIITAAADFARAAAGDPKRQFIPYAHNWLARERFVIARSANSQRKSRPSLSDEHWRQLLTAYRASGAMQRDWSRERGLPPQHGATSVPEHLLVEFGFR